MNGYFEKYEILKTHEPVPTKKGFLKHLNLTNKEFERMKTKDEFSYMLDRALLYLENILERFLYATNDGNKQYNRNVMDELITNFGWKNQIREQ